MKLRAVWIQSDDPTIRDSPRLTATGRAGNPDRSEPALGVHGRECSAVFLKADNGDALIAGGRSSFADLYDPTAGTFSATGKMITDVAESTSTCSGSSYFFSAAIKSIDDRVGLRAHLLVGRVLNRMRARKRGRVPAIPAPRPASARRRRSRSTRPSPRASY